MFDSFCYPQHQGMSLNLLHLWKPNVFRDSQTGNFWLSYFLESPLKLVKNYSKDTNVKKLIWCQKQLKPSFLILYLRTPAMLTAMVIYFACVVFSIYCGSALQTRPCRVVLAGRSLRHSCSPTAVSPWQMSPCWSTSGWTWGGGPSMGTTQPLHSLGGTGLCRVGMSGATCVTAYWQRQICPFWLSPC